VATRSADLRILLISPDFPPARGGIQVVAHQLAAHLDGEVRVVTLGPRGPQDGVLDVRRARSITASGPPAVAALNARAFREGLAFRPDAIVSAHLFAAPAAAALGAALRRPWVQYVYAMEMGQKPRLAAAALRSADAIVAISRYSRALAIDAGAPTARVRIIPPGVERPAERAPEPAAGRPTILTVARMAERYKGHDVLLRALPLVTARVPDAQWVVIGDGPLRPALELAARRAGAPARFLGSVTDEERDAWLGRSHVFAMPSRDPGGRYAGEGFGIVYLEAGVRGLPVLAGDAAGARDAVVDRVTGRLVDPTDHVAVASALIDLLLEPESSRAMGRAGAERAREFGWERIAARVGELLRELSR
jgi:phosphatidylinositol alpha-1,6-mannosyltransferase